MVLRMKCLSCGYDIDENVKKCNFCGAQIIDKNSQPIENNSQVMIEQPMLVDSDKSHEEQINDNYFESFSNGEYIRDNEDFFIDSKQAEEILKTNKIQSHISRSKNTGWVSWLVTAGGILAAVITIVLILQMVTGDKENTYEMTSPSTTSISSKNENELINSEPHIILSEQENSAEQNSVADISDKDIEIVVIVPETSAALQSNHDTQTTSAIPETEYEFIPDTSIKTNETATRPTSVTTTSEQQSSTESSIINQLDETTKPEKEDNKTMTSILQGYDPDMQNIPVVTFYNDKKDRTSVFFAEKMIGEISGKINDIQSNSSNSVSYIFSNKNMIYCASKKGLVEVDELYADSKNIPAVVSINQGTLAYLGQNRILYLYDNQKAEKTKIDEKVCSSFITISPDGKAVAYLKGDEISNVIEWDDKKTKPESSANTLQFEKEPWLENLFDYEKIASFGDKKRELLIYQNTRSRSAGTDIIPVALSDNGDYLYALLKKKMIVQDKNGRNKELTVSLSELQTCYFNQKQTEILLVLTNETLLSQNGEFAQKIVSKDTVFPFYTSESIIKSTGYIQLGIRSFFDDMMFLSWNKECKNLFFINNKYKISEIVRAEKGGLQFVSISKNKIPVVHYRDETGSLYAVVPGENPEKISDAIVYHLISADGNKLFFINKNNELWVKENKTKEKLIAKDVKNKTKHPVIMTKSNDSIYYQTESNDLYVWIDGKSVSIAEKVNHFALAESEQIWFLTTDKTLYSYSAKTGKSEIASDVLYYLISDYANYFFAAGEEKDEYFLRAFEKGKKNSTITDTTGMILSSPYDLTIPG